MTVNWLLSTFDLLIKNLEARLHFFSSQDKDKSGF